MHAPRLFLPILFACLICISGAARATTWNEPWHREVVSTSTSFGLYEIVTSDPKSITLKRIKRIAGDDTGSEIKVTTFYALRLTSHSSGHDPEFRLPKNGRAYFFLKRVGNEWAIATPTAGYAGMDKSDTVFATYRFSAHQAKIDAKTYELTQRCIFQLLHGVRPCDPQVAAFIRNELDNPAEGIGADSTEASRGVFFRQHVALETAGFTGTPIPDDTLERFLSKPDTHVQMSALRAFVASPRPGKADRLLRFVKDEKATLPARIMAALLLKEIGAHEMKQALLDYVGQASVEETGLGMNIMDPRVGTYFPSTLKQAVKLVGEQL